MSTSAIRIAARARGSRRGQFALVLFATIVAVATASFVPIAISSLSRGLVVSRFDQQGTQNTVTVDSSALEPDQLLSTAGLAKAVDPRLKAVLGAGTATLQVQVSGVQLVYLRYTEDACAHVHLAAGHCPRARNEVMVSETAARQLKTPASKVGDDFRGTQSYAGVSPTQNPTKTLRIVGLFTGGDSGFWHGADVGSYHPSTPSLNGALAPVATLLTSSATFDGSAPTGRVSAADSASSAVSWNGIDNSVTFPIIRSRLSADSLRTALPGVAATNRNLSDGRRTGTLTEPITQIRAQVHDDLDQVGRLLPVLLLQLGVVVLIFVGQLAGFVTQTRRRELGLLKLRGRGRSGALLPLAIELAPAVPIALPLGLLLAYGADWLTRAVWLPAGVGWHWSWWALLWGGVAVAAVGLVLLASAWRASGESISALVRVMPTRIRRIGLPMWAALVAVLCLAGLILVATGSLSGAVALAVPTLLSMVVGLVVMALIAPVGTAAARAALRRGRSGAALLFLQTARRPGVAACVLTLVTSSALVVFCASAVAQGSANREHRAQADLGAAEVVTARASYVSVTPADGLLKAVDDVDPQHRHLTPVVRISTGSGEGPSTMGVVPRDMERIALHAGLSAAVPWRDVDRNDRGGAQAAIAARWTQPAAVGASFQAPAMSDMDGQFRVVAVAPYLPGAGQDVFVVDLHRMLSAGTRTDNLTQQVWSNTTDPKLIGNLKRALRARGLDRVSTATVAAQQRRYDDSATAWSMQLGLVVSAVAVAIALTSLAVMASASRRQRVRDLRSLRVAGVPSTALRFATIAEFALIALIGGVLGVLTTPLGADLAGSRIPWWASDPPFAVTRTGLDRPVAALAATALIVVLLVCAFVLGRSVAAAVRRHREGVDAA